MTQEQIAEPRGRLDHLLPQGYLDGFINPSMAEKLSVYDIQKRRWFESGTKSVAAIKGFYDYSPGSVPDQTADQAFKEFENTFPNLRRDLVASGFSGWKGHLDFLLRYAQMLRTRSELFRQQSLADIRTRTMMRVTEVFTDPSTGRMGVRYEELAETADERETLFRNMSITTMRTEIAKGPAEFSKLNWCLRLTMDSTQPVITADSPIIVEGNSTTIQGTLDNAQTLIFFPLCWQACLIGSPAQFQKENDLFEPSDLKLLQSRYMGGDCRFAYSPVRL